MPIQLYNYPLSHFQSLKASNTIKTDPAIQRRPVWTDKSKMLFIDSLARQVPVGAITLYKDESPGYAVWEVIDGKQRLSTLFEFLNDGFVVDQALVRSIEQEELADIGIEHAQPVYGKAYSTLDVVTTQRLLQYQIPVFEVSGSRDQAVQAFTRMNQNSYVLKPQEIRNAVYAGSQFLLAAVGLCNDFTSFLVASAPDAESGLVGMGVVTGESFKRMQDIQFAAELIALSLNGEQHRRDSLNSYFDLYRAPGAPALKELSDAQSRTQLALRQVAEIFDSSPLPAYHFPASCENDMYALIGALLDRGLFSAPQLAILKDEIRQSISEFRRQVQLFITAVRGGQDTTHFGDAVATYGQTFLGGQQNSQTRRTERRTVLVAVLNEVAGARSADAFSQITRAIIWARSADKLCARCGTRVEYGDFHAGHITPKSLGGMAVFTNGQVEHAACNVLAGAAHP